MAMAERTDCTVAADDQTLTQHEFDKWRGIRFIARTDQCVVAVDVLLMRERGGVCPTAILSLCLVPFPPADQSPRWREQLAQSTARFDRRIEPICTAIRDSAGIDMAHPKPSCSQ